MSDLLVKGGLVVTSAGTFMGDVLIKGGKIIALGKELPSNSIPVFDAKNKLVLPGIIDAHVQLECAYKDIIMTDDFATGTKAAAAGGVTTIIDFADQASGHTPLEELDLRMELANSKVNVDYTLHLGVTDISGNQIGELEEAVLDRGINSFKLYMAYRKRGRMVDEGQIYAIMKEASKIGAVVGVHAENEALIDYILADFETNGKTATSCFPKSRPDLAEQLSIGIACTIANYTGAVLYVHHLSTALGLDTIRKARQSGVQVFAETCPQYLILDDEVYKRTDGHLFVMNPPIRSKSDIDALWEGIKNQEIQVIGTDHCSYSKAQKSRSIDDFRLTPAGIPGIETLLPLIYSEGYCKNRISLQHLVELLSLNPAKIFNLYPQKGDITIGGDGDLVIYNPDIESVINTEQLEMNVDFSPFEGMVVSGKVDATILRGMTIYKEGQWRGPENCGSFIRAIQRQ